MPPKPPTLERQHPLSKTITEEEMAYRGKGWDTAQNIRKFLGDPNDPTSLPMLPGNVAGMTYRSFAKALKPIIGHGDTRAVFTYLRRLPKEVIETLNEVVPFKEAFRRFRPDIPTQAVDFIGAMYNPKQKLIGLRDMNYPEDVFHELSHHYQNLLETKKLPADKAKVLDKYRGRYEDFANNMTEQIMEIRDWSGLELFLNKATTNYR